MPIPKPSVASTLASVMALRRGMDPTLCPRCQSDRTVPGELVDASRVYVCRLCRAVFSVPLQAAARRN